MSLQSDSTPSHRQLAGFWVLTVAAVALHNTEEWLLRLTEWIADHPWMPGRALHGDQTQYGLALIIVTAAVLAIAIVAVTRRTRWSSEVLACMAYALIINATSHLLLSVATWDLMPGTISGTLLLAPLGLIIIHTLPPVPWSVSSAVTIALAAIGIVIGSLLLAAALTALV